MNDLSIAGPGSPISLKKTLKKIIFDKTDTGFKVFIDNDGIGIENDTDDTITMTVQDCFEQGDYYIDNYLANGEQLSLWLFKYLDYLFEEAKYFNMSNEDIISTLTPEDPSYITIKNRIKYGKSSPEVRSIIGFIILLGGSLNLAKKEKKSVNIFMDYIDSHWHPQRSRKFVMLFNKIREDYS